MDDDALWRKRLAIYSLVRLAGLAIFFLGIAIMYTGLLRPGGWPQVGVIDAMFAPRLIKRSWDAAEKDAPKE